MEASKVKRVYNRPISLTNLNLFKTISKAIDTIGVNYSALRDLVTICDYYTNYNTGLRSSGIVKILGHTDGSYQALYSRLQLLQSKGLVYTIDHYYYPTNKAIQLLNSITV